MPSRASATRRSNNAGAATKEKQEAKILFQQFFNASLLNPFREILLDPIASFPGQHVMH